MSAKKEFLELELSESPWVNYGVLIGTLLLITAISLSGYFAYSNYMTFAPTHIAVDRENHVVINIEDRLYQINPNGKIVSSIDYSTIKVERIADIGFIDDGLIVVDHKGKIYKCTIDLTSCANVDFTHIYQDAKLHIDLITFANFFYLINRYKFNKYDSNGKFIERVKLDDPDFVPIRGVAENNTTIMLFNKENRVVTVRSKKEKQSLATQQNYQIAIDERIMNLALDKNHNLWLITKQNIYFIDNQNLLPLTKDSQKVASYAIEPVNIVAFKEGVLVLDHKSMQLLYTQKSEVLQVFGSHEIQNLLKHLKLKKEQYHLYEMIFQIISFVAIAFMALLLWLESKRSPLFPDSLKFRKDKLYTLTKEKEIEPDSRGIIWIRPRAEFLEYQKRLYWVAMLSVVLLIGVASYFMKVPFLIVLPFMLMGVLAFISGMQAHKVLLNHTLGVDDEYFYFKCNDVDIKVKIEESYYRDYILYFDNRPFALNPKENKYDEDQLGTYFYPKLNQATYYSGWELFKKRLRARDRETIQTILLVLFALVLLFFLEYWKGRDF